MIVVSRLVPCDWANPGCSPSKAEQPFLTPDYWYPAHEFKEERPWEIPIFGTAIYIALCLSHCGNLLVQSIQFFYCTMVIFEIGTFFTLCLTCVLLQHKRARALMVNQISSIWGIVHRKYRAKFPFMKFFMEICKAHTELLNLLLTNLLMQIYVWGVINRVRKAPTSARRILCWEREAVFQAQPVPTNC